MQATAHQFSLLKRIESGTRGIVVDLFAGGGGASTGMEAALGRVVDLALNHDPVAIATHMLNHPDTEHLTADVWEIQPKKACRGRKVDVLWLSPDCRHHSRARGGKPRGERVRSLAWVGVRWARDVSPRIIFLENVSEFAEWGPLDEHDQPVASRKGETFRRWVAQLQALGYAVDWRVLDASRYGAPTKRRRLFVVARRDGEPIVWPTPTHGPGLRPVRTAAECIDWELPVPSIFDRARPLAAKTMERIAHGIRRFVIDDPKPYIVSTQRGRAAPTLIQTSYGERKGQAPRVLDLHEPLGTIVAGGQKHALVMSWLAKHYGGVVGLPMQSPLSTVTARDHHSLVNHRPAVEDAEGLSSRVGEVVQGRLDRDFPGGVEDVANPATVQQFALLIRPRR